jgi:hypothetical protein
MDCVRGAVTRHAEASGVVIAIVEWRLRVELRLPEMIQQFLLADPVLVGLLDLPAQLRLIALLISSLRS